MIVVREKLSVPEAIAQQIEYNSELTAYTDELRARSNKDKLDELCKIRAFDRETLDKCGAFYVGEMTEMLLPKYFKRVSDLGVISDTNHKPIFRNRWVFPIHDTDGLVQNLVGYSPYADERYIYGTSKYYRRRDTYYGLENLELAYNMGYAFITEGITDTIRLRDIGFPNSFAMCGTHSSDFMIRQLNRCRYGVILIPDRDDPGLRALKQWNFYRSATIFVNFQFKDIDELCYTAKEDGTRVKNVENIEWFKEYAKICVDWITSGEHNSINGLHEQITMI